MSALRMQNRQLYSYCSRGWIGIQLYLLFYSRTVYREHLLCGYFSINNPVLLSKITGIGKSISSTHSRADIALIDQLNRMFDTRRHTAKDAFIVEWYHQICGI